MDILLANLLVFGPLIAAIAIAILPAARADRARSIALWSSAALCLFGLVLWSAAAFGSAPLVGETKLDWIVIGEKAFDDDPGEQSPKVLNGLVVRYHVAADPISAPLIALTAILMPLAIGCSWRSITTRTREYYAWMMLLAAGMFGVFLARDMLLFYIFFEFTLLPLYFLIGIWGGDDRKSAANKFFLYTFAGSMITFSGLLYLAARGAVQGSTGLWVDFDLARLTTLEVLTPNEQFWLFLAMFAGFAIKVPFFPLHTWLPLAHTEAPTAGSVLLAGVLLKLGTYGFLRIALPLAPAGAVMLAQVMGALAVGGIIYGALCCWVQKDIKKLVAYSSVSHLGFCMLGMFSFLPVGLSGSMLYMVNHGISTGALFLMVGMVYDRYHTRQIADYGGMARKMPVFAFFFLLFVLSSIGLPGLNGFVSEFTTLFAAYVSSDLGPVYGVLGATGILLGAIYLLYLTGSFLFGPLKEPGVAHAAVEGGHGHDGHAHGTSSDGHGTAAHHHQSHGHGNAAAAMTNGYPADLSTREIALLTPLAILVVLLGFFPRLITDSLDPALRSTVIARIDHAKQSLATARSSDAAERQVAAVSRVFGESEQ
jgi:NADH-quinone oxidoreductase subunit M